jgi:hypothetical protein
VREGAAVFLVFARARQEDNRAPDNCAEVECAEVETVTLAATVGVAEPDKEPVSLTFPAATPGAPPSVPAGAIVVDAASGYALGIVAEANASATARFTTFPQFHSISNAVGLRPTPKTLWADAATLDAAMPDGTAPNAGAPDGDVLDASRDTSMVFVPGGPLALTKDDYTEFVNLVAMFP